MFTKRDGPQGLVTVIRALVTDTLPLETTGLRESLLGDVERLQNLPLTVAIIEVIDDYEKLIPQISRTLQEELADANKLV